MTGSQAQAGRSLWLWAAALGGLSLFVARGGLQSVDHQVSNSVSALRAPVLDGLMKTITFFGSSMWAVMCLVGLTYWCVRQGHARTGVILLGAFVTGFLLQVTLRLVVSQWRPDLFTIPASMDPMTKFQLTGFPSGHGVRSAFVFGWLARELWSTTWRWARIGIITCFMMIGLVGISRVYLNRHWASDVIGSWLVVLVVFTLAHIWERTRAKD